MNRPGQLYTDCTHFTFVFHSTRSIWKPLVQTRSLYTHSKPLDMSMKFVHFDNGTVLIAIAIYIAILNSPGHLYTVCTAFTFVFHSTRSIWKPLVQTRSLYTHSKLLNMSMKFVHFDSGTVLIIAIAILYSYFEQTWSACTLSVHTSHLFSIQPGPFGSLWSKPEVCTPI